MPFVSVLFILRVSVSRFVFGEASDWFQWVIMLTGLRIVEREQVRFSPNSGSRLWNVILSMLVGRYTEKFSCTSMA